MADATQSDDIMFLYGDIVKRDDSQHIVEGFISSDQVDLGGHIVDPEWLKAALPKWFSRWGNVREMHDPKRAVGITKTLEADNVEGPFVGAKIVDPAAWEKVVEGVYKGFSLGFKNPVVVPDSRAPHGRICGGDILELSIVDRPANPAAVFVAYKSAGNGAWKDMQSGVILEPAVPSTPPPEPSVKDVTKQIRQEYDKDPVSVAISKEGVAVLQKTEKPDIAVASPDISKCDLPGCDCTCKPGKPDPDCTCNCDECQGIRMMAGLKARVGGGVAKVAQPSKLPSTQFQMKPISPDLIKRDFDTSSRKKAAAAGQALPDGSFPIITAEDLSNAIQAFGRAKDKAAAKAHIIKRARALGKTSMLPESWTGKNVEKTEESTVGAVTADVEKAQPPHIHPFKGTHNHPHDDQRGGNHTHEHLHDNDDMHDHQHCTYHGKDARVCAPQHSSATPSMYMTTASDITASTADIEKAAADFAATHYVAPLPSLVERLGTVETLMKEIRAQVESLANQTDDRDGDVDFAANERGGVNDSTPPTAPTLLEKPTLVTPETLPLTMHGATNDLDLSTVPDIVKSISELVDKKVAERFQAMQTPEHGPTSADIAKYAGAIADGLKNLAGLTSRVEGKLEAVEKTVGEGAAEIEKIKKTAMPLKGQVMVVEKTIGVDSPPQVPAQQSNLTFEQLTERASKLPDAEQRALAQQLYGIVTSETIKNRMNRV